MTVEYADRKYRRKFKQEYNDADHSQVSAM